MRLHRLFLSMILFGFYPLLSFAQNTGSTDNYLTFQVIQDEMVFDNTNIKNASLVQNNGIFTGLEIELKSPAAQNFSQLTKANLGKKIIIVLNKRIVASAVLQSPLGKKLLITGITKYEAETFLTILHINQQKIDYLKEQQEAQQRLENPNTPPPIVQDVIANN